MRMVRKGCKTPGKIAAIGCCSWIKFYHNSAPEPYMPGKSNRKGF